MNTCDVKIFDYSFDYSGLCISFVLQGGEEMNDVTVYTQARCGYSGQLKDFLKRNHIEYTEKDVSDRKHFDELMELKGQGVPFTLIYNKPYAGFNERVKTALMSFNSQN